VSALIVAILVFFSCMLVLVVGLSKCLC